MDTTIDPSYTPWCEKLHIIAFIYIYITNTNSLNSLKAKKKKKKGYQNSFGRKLKEQTTPSNLLSKIQNFFILKFIRFFVWEAKNNWLNYLSFWEANNYVISSLCFKKKEKIGCIQNCKYNMPEVKFHVILVKYNIKSTLWYSCD